SEMIDAIIGEYVRQGVDVWVFDTAADRSPLVHAVMAEGATSHFPKDIAPDAPELHRGLFFEAPLDMAGRPWKVLVRPTAVAVAAERGIGHWVLMVIGLIITAFCSLLARGIIR